VAGAAGSVIFSPAGPLRGTLQVPADKSISHRAVIIASLCHSPVRIRNFLNAKDTLSTMQAISACGVKVERKKNGILVVHGVGLRGLKAPEEVINVGNSGTSMRLLPGVFAGQEGCFILDGDDSIRRRPMDRLVEPLKLMGVDIEARQGCFSPLKVCGGDVHAISYQMPVASAQVKSSLLLAGLFADGPTEVSEPLVCRDHTEIMLKQAGARLEKEGLTTRIYPATQLNLTEVDVPGDISSAAFFMVAATVVPGSEILLTNVGVNPSRTGLIDILSEMGAKISWENKRLQAGEPVADLRVQAALLRGTQVGGDISGRAIDELPLVALAGAFAEGDTVVRGAAELKVKESDRITGLVVNLAGVGVDFKALGDGFVVHGGAGISGGRFKSLGDHRLAMLGAVAGIASRNGVRVQGFDCTSVSYPGFREGLMKLVS
jgi:3-phosphoshikimate 1-carboxyvinyltransferase